MAKRELEMERARETRLSRGKRRAPATSSLTAVNGRSLRRSTARERGRENKRLRQMDGDSCERRWERGGKRRRRGEKRGRKRRYLYYSKKSDRENRETGRLRPWQPARTSRRARGRSESYIERTRLHGKNCAACQGERRYDTWFKGHAHRGIAPRLFSMQNKILQI